MANESSFDLKVPEVRIVYGAGSLSKAGDEVAALGRERALVVSGRSIAEKTPTLAILKESLGQRFAGAFTGVTYNLSKRTEARDHLVELIKETKSDLLISVGGGIAIGTARAARTRYIGETEKNLPMMCVPTTLSAAEANTAYVAADEGGPRVPEPGSRPVTAILDPELATHTPRELFGSSGFNAINHCIEGMCSTAHHSFADALYLQALRLLADNLAESLNPDNLEARGKALLGGYMSGLMIESTWLGIAHALCHGLQSVFGTPHGMNNTVMVTWGMRYNLDVAAERIAAVAPGLELLTGPKPRETALRCIASIEGLRRRMSLPERLRDIPGVDPKGFPQAAEIALHDFFTPYNPRQPQTTQELVEVYKQAW